MLEVTQTWAPVDTGAVMPDLIHSQSQGKWSYMSRLKTLEPKYFHLILDMYRPTFRVQHNILLTISLSHGYAINTWKLSKTEFILFHSIHELVAIVRCSMVTKSRKWRRLRRKLQEGLRTHLLYWTNSYRGKDNRWLLENISYTACPCPVSNTHIRAHETNKKRECPILK